MPGTKAFVDPEMYEQVVRLLGDGGCPRTNPAGNRNIRLHNCGGIASMLLHDRLRCSLSLRKGDGCFQVVS